jgi:hypothetical protein
MVLVDGNRLTTDCEHHLNNISWDIASGPIQTIALFELDADDFGCVHTDTEHQQ